MSRAQGGTGSGTLAVSPGTHWAGGGSPSISGSRRDGVTPLGDQLRAERERRGALLEQVSEATRIRTTYLEALEGHDWQALPADVFTRGYVRTYAQYLGLDQEHLLKVYARERRIAGVDGPSTSRRDEPDAARAFLERLARTQGVEARRSRTRIKWIVLSLIGVGVGGLAVWTFLDRLGPGWGEPTAIEVPSHVERLSVVAPPRTNAIGVGDTSPASHPSLAPTAKQPPTPPAEPSSASHLEVPEFGVGTAVQHHRLVGRRDRFPEGTVVWFWTIVLGGRRGDKIQHVWSHEGRSIAVTELGVDGAHWRTQSRQPLPMGSTGNWTVEARDREGRLIASVGFTCVAAE